VHTDVVAQKVDPSRVFAVNSVLERGNRCTPLALGEEGNVWCGVVHECERAHPKMESQEGNKPVFDYAPYSNEVKHDGEKEKRVIVNSFDAAFHFLQLIGFKRFCSEVFPSPVSNTPDKPHRAPCNSVGPLFNSRTVGIVVLSNWLPSGIDFQFVCVLVVDVVLYPPGVERV